MTKIKIRPKRESRLLKEDGIRLARIQRSSGLSDEEFANLFKCSKSALGYYKRGEYQIPRLVQWRIWQEVGVNVYEASLKEIYDANHKSNKVTLRFVWETVKAWRQIQVNYFERFCAERFSSFGNKLIQIRTHVFFTSIFTYYFRLLANRFDLPLLSAEPNIDWALIGSALLIVIIIPFETRDLLRYYLWRRYRHNIG